MGSSLSGSGKMPSFLQAAFLSSENGDEDLQRNLVRETRDPISETVL